MERLREHLGIARWQVFGGSWGSTLALAYAEAHPERVTELVLRGIFLLRKQEIDWFYQRGADAMFPDAWEEYLAPIPEEERGDLLSAYYRRLTGPDAAVRQAAARAWSVWEGRTSCLYQNPDLDRAHRRRRVRARVRAHRVPLLPPTRGFFEKDTQLLDDVHKIRHIPTVIVQGRYDVVCPMESAWALHRAFPEADLRIVADAGHSAYEPGNLHELIEARTASAEPSRDHGWRSDESVGPPSDLLRMADDRACRHASALPAKSAGTRSHLRFWMRRASGPSGETSWQARWNAGWWGPDGFAGGAARRVPPPCNQ